LVDNALQVKQANACQDRLTLTSNAYAQQDQVLLHMVPDVLKIKYNNHNAYQDSRH